MPRRRTGPKRPSIWENPAPYGTTDVCGDPDMWRAAFGEAMNEDQVVEILGDNSPWSILGIPIGSAMDVIKSAYRKLAAKWHPDHNDGCKNAANMFMKVHAAYIRLKG